MVGVGRSDSDGGPAGSTAAADYAQTNNTAGIIAIAAMASFACGDSPHEALLDRPSDGRAGLAPGDLHVGGRFDLRRLSGAVRSAWTLLARPMLLRAIGDTGGR